MAQKAAPPKKLDPAPPRAAFLTLKGEELLLLEWPVRAAPLPSCLTSAERDVATLLAAGLSNAEIARRRGTAVRTVANQVASVFSKLGVRSRLELFARSGSRTEIEREASR